MYKLIRCMSKSSRDIGAELDEKARQVVVHLIKIYMFRERGNLIHWMDELFGFLHSVSRLKGKNKFPSSEFIFRNMWEGQKIRFHRLVSQVYSKYSKAYEPYDVTEDEIEDFVVSYLHWVADELSKYGELLDSESCVDKVKELLNEVY